MSTRTEPSKSIDLRVCACDVGMYNRTDPLFDAIRPIVTQIKTRRHNQCDFAPTKVPAADLSKSVDWLRIVRTIICQIESATQGVKIDVPAAIVSSIKRGWQQWMTLLGWWRNNFQMLLKLRRIGYITHLYERQSEHNKSLFDWLWKILTKTNTVLHNSSYMCVKVTYFFWKFLKFKHSVL